VRCFGRIAARDIVSPMNVPGFDNSAMDIRSSICESAVSSGISPAVKSMVGSCGVTTKAPIINIIIVDETSDDF
jgi:molybdopterin biosynthesis enzyme